jgi:protein-disulfide isomerase
MKFYLKTWFILFLVITLSLLLFGIIFLSDTATKIELFGAKNDSFQKALPSQKTDWGLREGAPAIGNKGAGIVVVEFSDFQCPFCREAFFILQDVLARHTSEIYFQYRHFPLDTPHPLARKAAEASMCANQQGKFWEYHDLIFRNQDTLTPASLLEFAIEVGLDGSKFASCLKSDEFKKYVEEDFQAGKALGVEATPTFFINGRKIQGVLPKDVWEQLIREIR